MVRTTYGTNKMTIKPDKHTREAIESLKNIDVSKDAAMLKRHWGSKEELVHDGFKGDLRCPDCGMVPEQDHNSFWCDNCEKLWPKDGDEYKEMLMRITPEWLKNKIETSSVEEECEAGMFDQTMANEMAASAEDETQKGMAAFEQEIEMMANPHILGLSKGRFSSSGDQLPVTRIIARVLADPVEADIVILKQHFGMDMIMATWKQLTERGDIAESVVPITQKIITALCPASDEQIGLILFEALVETGNGTILYGDSYRWMAEKVLEHADEKYPDYLHSVAETLNRIADALDKVEELK